ncbi:MAG: hypothetical protein JO249_27125 [Acidobacteria bacterium]|nr:hypothetical protein [Acidobacteriota bacterium]
MVRISLRSARARKLTLAGWMIAASVLWVAARDFTKPRAQLATAYPAHDEHKDEGVAVAVDPYDVPDKAQIFSTNYRADDLLPMLLVITNQGDEPVSLTSMKAELVTVNRSKIEASDEDDVFRRLSHPSASTGPSYPLPLPRKKVKAAVNQKTREEVESARFGAKAVEPHSTQSGFLFFDVAGISTPLAGAHFYLTGLRNAKGDELMYFEVSMEKSLSSPAAKP